MNTKIFIKKKKQRRRGFYKREGDHPSKFSCKAAWRWREDNFHWRQWSQLLCRQPPWEAPGKTIVFPAVIVAGSTSKCRCTTPDTLRPTTSRCRSGSSTVCSPSTAFPSPGMSTRRGSLPWVLFSGLVKYFICLIFGLVLGYKVSRGRSKCLVIGIMAPSCFNLCIENSSKFRFKCRWKYYYG